MYVLYLKLKYKPICMCPCAEMYPGQIHYAFTIKIIFTKEVMIPDGHSQLSVCNTRLVQLEGKYLIKYRIEGFRLVRCLFLPFSIPTRKGNMQ